MGNPTFVSSAVPLLASKPYPKNGQTCEVRAASRWIRLQGAFIRRVLEPIAKVFGENPKELFEAAKLLGGTCLECGDAAVEVPALAGIPLVFIVWGESDLPASANVLFDESASSYLPTEDLAVLGEVTA